jgi:hypothetical protein
LQHDKPGVASLEKFGAGEADFANRSVMTELYLGARASTAAL